MTFGRFKIWPILPVVLAKDVRATLDALKPGIALLVCGYGAKEKNFHVQQMARCGFAEAADRIQELWLAGHREEAIKAVPDEYPDSTRLIGPAARVRERWVPWSRAGVTGYTIYTQSLEGLELLAELAGTRE
jgi:hypothetical protein